MEKDFKQKLKKILTSLYYISFSDSQFLIFEGSYAEVITKDVILRQTKSNLNLEVEEINFDEFFSYLTKEENWFNVEQLKVARKFYELEQFLKENLTQLKIFGIENIQENMYIVGLDSNNNLVGIQTKVLET